jgi:hypothetical protein
MSSRWTHSICAACWNAREPLTRRAFPDASNAEDKCCFCGAVHRSGIYVRHDPEDPRLKCKGTGHDTGAHQAVTS